MSVSVQSLVSTVVTQKLAVANLTVTGPLTNQSVGVSFTDTSLVRVSIIIGIPVNVVKTGESVIGTLTITDTVSGVVQAVNTFMTTVASGSQIAQGMGLFMSTPNTTMTLSLAPSGTDTFPTFATVNINVEGL